MLLEVKSSIRECGSQANSFYSPALRLFLLLRTVKKLSVSESYQRRILVLLSLDSILVPVEVSVGGFRGSGIYSATTSAVAKEVILMLSISLKLVY